MLDLLTYLSRYKKTVAAVVGLVVVLVTGLQAGFGDDLPDWVPTVGAIATAFSVWWVKNTTPEGLPPDPDVSEAERGLGVIEALLAVLLIIVIVVVVLAVIHNGNK